MTYDKKRQFGGYTKRRWKQIRQLVRREVWKDFNIETMKYKLNDYKGKYFIIQDKIDPDDFMGFEVGEIEDKDLTDDYLRNHVENATYYGIPAYYGDNKELKERIKRFEDEYDKL